MLTEFVDEAAQGHFRPLHRRLTRLLDDLIGEIDAAYALEARLGTYSRTFLRDGSSWRAEPRCPMTNPDTGGFTSRAAKEVCTADIEPFLLERMEYRGQMWR